MWRIGGEEVGKTRGFSTKLPREAGHGFFVGEDLEGERSGFRACEHDNAFGIEFGEAEVPDFLHVLCAQAGPAEHGHVEN